MTLRAQFIDYCRKDPGAPAVRAAPDTHTITRGQLFDGSVAKAARLHHAGIVMGERVFLALQTTGAFSQWFWALQLLGAVAIPIAPFTSQRRQSSQMEHLRALLRLTQAKALISTAGGMLTAADIPELLVLTDDQCESRSPESVLPAPPVKPNDYAVIQFSSGSTGRPRGCLLTHRAMSANACTWVDAFGYRDGECTYNWMPLFHDFGLMLGVLAPVFGGMSAILLRTEAFVSSPAAWLRGLSGVGPVHTAGSPTALSMVCSRLANRRPQALDLHHVRSLVCAAEPIHPRVVEEFFERTKDLGFDPDAFYAGYGMSETTVMACAKQRLCVDYVNRFSAAIGSAMNPAVASPGVASFVSVGTAPKGSEFRIMDTKGGRLSERRLGHIEIRSPGLMDGYVSDSAETPTVLKDGWLSTGDVGYLADGQLHFVARSKDLIVVAGRKVVPSDVDDAVGEKLGIPITRVASCGIADGATEGIAIAIESRSPEVDAMRRAAGAACFDRTGITPLRVVVCPIGTIPRTSSGKVRRGLLSAWLQRAVPKRALSGSRSLDA